MLWTQEDLRTALDGEIVTGNNAFHGGSGISIDTRTLKAGDVFIALHGGARDGHAFIAQAIEKKASLVIVDQISFNQNTNAVDHILHVKNTFHALQAMGRYRRTQVNAIVCAITGSCGKTSTKEMLRTVCALHGKTHASQESYNNHWGVPLTLALMPKETQYAIFEVGMNHAGEIRPLVDMIAPHVSVITNIAPAHIGPMGSLEAIAKEKGDIFTPQSIAIFHHDDSQEKEPIQNILQEKATYAKAVVRIDKGTLHETSYPLQDGGMHDVMNAALVDHTARVMAVPQIFIHKGLSAYRPLKGRGETSYLTWQGGGTVTLIDDAYNANPTSMAAGLARLASLHTRGRKIVVLGSMLELGDHCVFYHQQIVSYIIECGADKVFACGVEMASGYDALPSLLQGGYAENVEDLWPLVLQEIQGGDILFVKGSKGSRVALIVEKMKAHAMTFSSPVLSLAGCNRI